METKKVIYKLVVIATLYFLSFFVEKAAATWRLQRKNNHTTLPVTAR